MCRPRRWPRGPRATYGALRVEPRSAARSGSRGLAGGGNRHGGPATGVPPAGQSADRTRRTGLSRPIVASALDPGQSLEDGAHGTRVQIVEAEGERTQVDGHRGREQGRRAVAGPGEVIDDP